MDKLQFTLFSKQYSYSVSEYSHCHAFIAVILFFPFSFEFRTSRSLCLYSSIVFSFVSFSLILFNSILPRKLYPSYLTSFITSLFWSFIPSYLTTFPLSMVRIPHFFYFKIHPNISTKDMSSSYKCINLIFTLGKQLQIIYEQQMSQVVFILSSFIACVYLSKYQQQRHHTPGKQQLQKTVSPKYTSLHINLPRSSPLDLSDNFHCLILFSKKSLTLSAIPNNPIHLLIQLFGPKSYAFL